MVVKKKAAPARPSPFTRVEEWGEFSSGSPVNVTAPRWRGKDGRQLPRVSWRFRAHVTNVSTGKEWIEVYGGSQGYESIHSFAIELVELIVPKKTRKRKNNGY